jgi:D-alanyl-lipoteichoic acid acyltransferase DltB (MBOAT superfamily)
MTTKKKSTAVQEIKDVRHAVLDLARALLEVATATIVTAAAATFTLVLVSWVFFRASDLGAAWRYLGFMFGAGIDPDAGGSLGGAAFVGGLMDQQYHLMMFVVAAVVTWTCRSPLQTRRSIAR